MSIKRHDKNVPKNKETEPLSLKETKEVTILRGVAFLLAFGVVIFAGYKFRTNKSAEVPQQIIDAAPIEDVIEEVGNASLESSLKATTEEEEAEVVETSQNIDTASDYINFEKLIMQLSEYTEPEEPNGDAATEGTTEVKKNNAKATVVTEAKTENAPAVASTEASSERTSDDATEEVSEEEVTEENTEE